MRTTRFGLSPRHCDMAARSPQREDGEWFTAPEQVNHRRYEALRALHVEALTYAQAAERFGYTRWAMVNLVREYRGREAGVVRPAAAARPTARGGAGQGPRPWPGDPATAARAVHV